MSHMTMNVCWYLFWTHRSLFTTTFLCLCPLRRLSVMSGSLCSSNTVQTVLEQLNSHHSMFFMAATWFCPWVQSYYFVMMKLATCEFCRSTQVGLKIFGFVQILCQVSLPVCHGLPGKCWRQMLSIKSLF